MEQGNTDESPIVVFRSILDTKDAQSVIRDSQAGCIQRIECANGDYNMGIFDIPTFYSGERVALVLKICRTSYTDQEGPSEGKILEVLSEMGAAPLLYARGLLNSNTGVEREWIVMEKLTPLDKVVQGSSSELGILSLTMATVALTRVRTLYDLVWPLVRNSAVYLYESFGLVNFDGTTGNLVVDDRGAKKSLRVIDFGPNGLRRVENQISKVCKDQSSLVMGLQLYAMLGYYANMYPMQVTRGFREELDESLLSSLKMFNKGVNNKKCTCEIARTIFYSTDIYEMHSSIYSPYASSTWAIPLLDENINNKLSIVFDDV